MIKIPFVYFILILTATCYHGFLNPPYASGEEKGDWNGLLFVFIRTSDRDKHICFSFRQQVTAHKVLRITVQYVKLVQQTLYTGGAAQDGTGGEEVITKMFKCCETNSRSENDKLGKQSTVKVGGGRQSIEKYQGKK